MRLSIFIFFAFLAYSLPAATNTSPSLLPADIQTTINNSSAGDTVIIGAGTVTGTFNVNKPVTVQGGGIGVTAINGGVTLTCISKTQLTRLTGFSISGLCSRSTVILTMGGTITEYGLFRVDHCRITGGYVAGIETQALVSGVVDHCQVGDCYLEFLPECLSPFHNRSWQIPMNFGSTNAFVVEDCNIFKTSADACFFNGMWESSLGIRQVLRHCTFTNTSTIFQTPFLDVHGNNACVDTSINFSASHRGTRSTEIYNNIFNNGTAGGYKNYFRGGCMIVCSNTFIGLSGNGWRLDEEDIMPSPVHPFCTGTYPGQDMHWCWFFSNTQNGAPVANTWYSGLTGVDHDSTDAVMLRDGVNIFYEPPSASATGIPELFLPVNLRTSNPITNWIPLVYPHPLVSGGVQTNGTISVVPSSIAFQP